MCPAAAEPADITGAATAHSECLMFQASVVQGSALSAPVQYVVSRPARSGHVGCPNGTEAGYHDCPPGIRSLLRIWPMYECGVPVWTYMCMWGGGYEARVGR
jgi:hypothetical protein